MIVVGLALLLHGRANRSSSTFRFVFYIPGALASAAVRIGLAVHARSVRQPWLIPPANVLGSHLFVESIAPGNLPFVFAMIALLERAGGWIVIMYGALNTIPHELEEAARIDGAGPVTIALRLKLPLIRKWIAYMAILAFATGTQLFVELQLVNQASLGNGTRHLVVESAGLSDGLPVWDLQCCRCDLRLTCSRLDCCRGVHRQRNRTLQDGGSDAARSAWFSDRDSHGVRRLLCGAHHLAASGTDEVRRSPVTGGPFSFGGLQEFASAWKHLDAFSYHIDRAWIGNSLLYALGATAIVAGHGDSRRLRPRAVEIPGPQVGTHADPRRDDHAGVGARYSLSFSA